MRPRISVVVPVKDDAVELEACLRALARQTLRPHEVIVVDNGSADASRAVAERHGARVVVEPRPGIPAAAAAGYDAASGELIARLDADCRPPATWLADLEEALRGADAVTGPGLLRGRRLALSRAYDLAYLFACGLALGHAPLFGSNLGMRRSAWLAVRRGVHRDDAELHDDLDLSFHLGARFRVRRHRHLALSISGRPFDDVAAFRQRLRRGWRTVLVHWPEHFPPVRAAARAIQAVRGGRSRRSRS